jgi:hypothetical protein
MDTLTTGADVGTMLTGLSVLTATVVWTRTQWRDLRERRAATRLRNWHGYIRLEGVDTWYVRLAEEPKTPTGTVVVEVLDGEGGQPDAALAHSVRQIILGDGMLSRSPTPEEFEFLKAQRKERQATGFPVGEQGGPSGWLTRFARWPRRRGR